MDSRVVFKLVLFEKGFGLSNELNCCFSILLVYLFGF